MRVCLRLPAYSASAKIICFIEKLGDWGAGTLPIREVFFRISLVVRLVSGRNFRQLSLLELKSHLLFKGKLPIDEYSDRVKNTGAKPVPMQY
ncbi:hypothetical protein AO068_25745 [Pseudomonas sp. ICMP 3272]|uniref:Uncharacterized protein n=1 Tax=Pseudomonas savastanoi TaxID=29438 RepID=A0AAW3LSR2_PSESS|nr:hypothetical protein AO068_25745 [Pseudomonas sp. ICMP 3272]KTC51249.1 hypothetical protein AO258_26305 [Pseudomonas syringae ICMP 19498]KTC57574.1 hypothetical protein AO287_27105 [Pseudomonas savastanoi]